MFRNYTNYEIFEDGRIWSKYYNKFLKPQTTQGGYQRVGLVDNEGKLHHQLVHRVIWIAVNNCEIPEGMELNHLDEDKTNNHISNLELVTPKENINFGTRNARVAKTLSKRVGAYKDGELVMIFPSTAEAHRNGYNQGNVCSCCRNCYMREGNNEYKGFNWKYLD